MSVNVAVRQLRDPDLVADVAAVAGGHRLARRSCCSWS